MQCDPNLPLPLALSLSLPDFCMVFFLLFVCEALFTFYAECVREPNQTLCRIAIKYVRRTRMLGTNKTQESKYYIEVGYFCVANAEIGLRTILLY